MATVITCNNKEKERDSIPTHLPINSHRKMDTSLLEVNFLSYQTIEGKFRMLTVVTRSMVVGHVDSSAITTIVILRAAAGVATSFIELLGTVCVPLE